MANHLNNIDKLFRDGHGDMLLAFNLTFSIAYSIGTIQNCCDVANRWVSFTVKVITEVVVVVVVYENIHMNGTGRLLPKVKPINHGASGQKAKTIFCFVLFFLFSSAGHFRDRTAD